ncbi:Uncharacterized protein FWK35_00034130 [Aphis craccivora]|uniref:Uncharacterized protein n=1 Tax=Aphis craccivora TaxID=307492 RepID=A0A6G0Z8M1_APHCR|nr:Uncharacterized protein FWK35_00034130 [Aphis craccivora]
MNNKQISKEIKVRLNKICNLFKEIEELVCKDKNDEQMGQSSKYDYSCICVDGKQSVPEIIENVSNHNKVDEHKSCFEKHIKCKNLDRKKISSDIINELNEISSCCQKNYEENHEKNNSKFPNNRCESILSNKQIFNNIQNDCKNERFKDNIKYIKQKYTSYFDEINKNELNTATCSTIKKKVPQK